MSLAATKNTWSYFLLALLVVVATAERVYGIDRQSLWSDELFAVMASYKSFSGAWTMMLTDSHPPGYLTFMYFSLPLVGYSDFAVRFHALLFGLLWIPLVFLLCKRWFSLNAAVMAVAVVASGYNAVYYSQEARAYSMLMVFMLWNLICFLEILFAKVSTIWHKVGFLIASTLMLYFHYSGFVFFCAETLLFVILWIFYKRYSLKEFAILFGIPMLLYSPWLGIMYKNLVYAPDSWAISEPLSFRLIHKMLRELLGPDAMHFHVFIWTLPVTMLFAAWRQKRDGFSTQIAVVYSLVFLTVVPVLAFVVESWLGTPILEIRYIMAAMLLMAILSGWLGDNFLSLLQKAWLQKLVLTLAVFVLTVWTISANVTYGLYRTINKHPFREATAIVKRDIKKNSVDAQRYTTAMSHSYFEHYLKSNEISVDTDWPQRYYNVPQKIDLVESYLENHPDITYLYYLLAEPNDGAALGELKYRYKLVSHEVVPCEGCAAHIYKFNVQEKPDQQQMDSVGVNPVNGLTRLVAQEVENKDPSTYRVLYTHNWVLPYLERNGVTAQAEGWQGEYLVNGQADRVFQYLAQHPEVDTVYYLALQERSAEGAELMLQLRYRLLGETVVETKLGKLSLLTYKIKEAPVANEKILQRLRAGESNKVAEWLLQDIGNAAPDSLAVSVANDWLVPYVKLNGIPLDEAWIGSRYRHGMSDQEVASYIAQRSTIGVLYYVALRESITGLAVSKLQKQYTQTGLVSIPVTMGIVDIYKFDTKKKPLTEADDP